MQRLADEKQSAKRKDEQQLDGSLIRIMRLRVRLSPENPQELLYREDGALADLAAAGLSCAM